MTNTNKRREAIRHPQQARSQQRVEQILDACKQLIAEKGCAGLKMGDIAATAEISIASIYQYFPNKQAIITALATHYLEAFRINALNTLSEAPDDLDELWQRSMEIQESYYRMHREDPVVRDIWKGMATDKSLQDVNELDRITSIELFFEVAEHLFKPSKRAQVKQTLELFLDFTQVAVARAVELDEAAGRQKIELTKQMLSACWESSIKPHALAAKKR
jgi:AcrR family transcriptional regulator